jgi:hypothetical protein
MDEKEQMGSMMVLPQHPFRCRHPELGSGSISPLYPSACVARWMLKQVQHDGVLI